VPSPMPASVTRMRPWLIWRSSRRATPPRVPGSTWRSSWQRNWAREPTRRSRSWTPHSRNSRRTLDCTTMQPVPTPWPRSRSPRKTRQKVVTVERAIRLLRTAIQNGYSDYNHMQEDSDLDPLRELPAFAVIMKAGHLDRSYAAVWAGDFRFEASPLFGLDTAAQLQQCRELVAQGYRMVALSVARTSPGGL